MPDENYDPFKGDTGLKDDYDGTVVNAWFSADPNVGGGNLHLYLDVACDDGDDNQELRYGCGAEWASYDGGESAEHPKDTEMKPRGFNNRTAYFQLIAKALEVGAEEQLRTRSQQQFNNLGPRYAAIWKGLKFHWEVESEDVTFKDKTTQENVTRTMTRTLPTSFLGVVENPAAAQSPQSNPTSSPPTTQPAAASPTTTPATDAPQSATTAASATVGNETTQAQGVPSQPAAAPTEASNGAGQAGPLGSLDPTMTARLRVMATNQDYPTFVNSVMELDGGVLLSNNDLIAALGDEGLYNQLRAPATA